MVNCFATHVAVLETIGASGSLSREERLVLTDKLRQIAVVCLPNYMGFSIMTRENINAMLPPGKSLEDCEGSCLVETGKNISAEYIVQPKVSYFGELLTITVELYETSTGTLLDTFVMHSENTLGLLSQIEKRAPAMFDIIKGAKGLSSVNEGFSGFYQDTAFHMEGNRQFLVRVNSQPSGAMVSVDGRPKCKSTPCNVQLIEGMHTFSFAMDMYFDKDSVFEVSYNEQSLDVKLLPTFGTLDISPLMGRYGKLSELSVTVDDEMEQVGKIRLSVGNHHIVLSHRCYETMQFDVTIKNGSELVFDRLMDPAMGGLSLTAEDDNGPMSMAVYVDGEKKGMTPFYESIPICARLEIGSALDSVPVELKYHETVEFVYKGEPFRDRDGNVYRTVRIGEQVWMAENMNYDIPNSWCKGNNSENCQKYGRLYTWDAAQNVCPEGWHLPSADEFNNLIMAVGGDSISYKKLKSQSGWLDGENGDDAVGFSALPGDYMSAEEIAKFKEDKKKELKKELKPRKRAGGKPRCKNSAGFWTRTKKVFEGGGDGFVLKIGCYGSSIGLRSFESAYSVRCVKGDSDSDFKKVMSGLIYGTVSVNNQTYKTFKIDGQTWMAENLNVEKEGVSCYDEKKENCKKYGDLYTWNVARDVCPNGWHLPSMDEFRTLISMIGGAKYEGNGSALLKELLYDDASDKKLFYSYKVSFWTSTSEKGSCCADVLELYDNFTVGLENDLKTEKNSVLCKKNESLGSDDSLLQVKEDPENQKVFVKKGTMKDSRDKKIYKTVRIDSLVWMAENLNFKTKESWCYEGNLENCKKYGRLYSWKSAKKACPIGWHLPSKHEFETLITSVGEKKTGIKLKSQYGWKDGLNGSDASGFSALPAGIGYYYTDDWQGFVHMDNVARFWSSDFFESRFFENKQIVGYTLDLNYKSDAAYINWAPVFFRHSVRCVKD